MLLQTNRVHMWFRKVHYFSFFTRSMGGVVADRVLQSFKLTDS